MDNVFCVVEVKTDVTESGVLELPVEANEFDLAACRQACRDMSGIVTRSRNLRRNRSKPRFHLVKVVRRTENGDVVLWSNGPEDDEWFT